MRSFAASLAVLSFVVLFLVTAPITASPPGDGELPLPAGYHAWPKFLTAVQRPDAKQVRDIYINSVGATTPRGRPFPNGTIFVMENFSVKEQPDGTLKTGPDGMLVKGELSKIFVMGKGEGWGQGVPDALKTGSWVFAAFSPDGKPLAENFNKCRTCHVPMTKKDFVIRYDEYFSNRDLSITG